MAYYYRYAFMVLYTYVYIAFLFLAFNLTFYLCTEYTIVTSTFFVCKGMAAIADGKHHGKAVIPTIILWKPSAIMNNWVFHKIIVAIPCLTAIGGCHPYRT